MNISAKIRALIALSGFRQIDLMECLSMKSPQSLCNKFSNNRWSANDLIAVAGKCGCKLAFVFPNGQSIIFDE